ncbi:hypothetical protein QBC43DRAFT_318095 [Cladorrhinum sp. PSN259]|nr:hypothetical protein QBC43DRAFT_318095 [Cladorrhinum sp. PSN259]
MSAPATKTIHDLNGTWVMSKTLSDDMDPSLVIQGIPWIVRKAVSWATITGNLTQKKDTAGYTAITIAQTATGGIKGETETHRIDNSEIAHSSAMFGTQRVRTSWLDLVNHKPATGVSTGEGLDPYLTEGWLEDGGNDGSPGHILVHVSSDKSGWTAQQVWGFALIDGKRHFVKRFIVRNREQDQRADVRIVYEWVPPKP